jgi:hypothetical protein
MTLIFWFLGFMILGDVLAYFIGRFVEYEWGAYASLVVFLALYFLSLLVALGGMAPFSVGNRAKKGGSLIRVAIASPCYPGCSPAPTR